MSSRLDKAIKDFIQIIREAGNKGTSPLDAQAEVLRIDEDGTAWVHLPGGVDETPVKLTINAEVGDKVYVRLSGGRAWITGNQTAPPTDDKTAEQAKEDAANASKVATNFMEYDSTNGLIVGNKTSGSWSGYRSQILPGSFNVLDPSSTVLASFGPTTVIGEEANANMYLTFNNLSMVDRDGTKFFEVGDNRNFDGIANVDHATKVTTNSSGSATVSVSTQIDSIRYVVVDGAGISSSNYSFSGKDVTINGLKANKLVSIQITYTTKSSTVYLTVGNRNSSANIGNYSIAEGDNLIASGYASHAEGSSTTASGFSSHAEGYNTKAKGDYSHAEGHTTTASGNRSHAEGTGAVATGPFSHAEGNGTEASEENSHAEGVATNARGYTSHTEGGHTEVTGNYSHAEGYGTVVAGNASHAEGYNTKAPSYYAHAEGKCTIASSGCQHVSGVYNIEDANGVYAFIIGNGDGDSDEERSNAFAVDWTGNVYMNLRDCTITDSGTALSVTSGAPTLDGLLAQSIINNFSYADAKEILDMPGDVNMNVKKLLQKIVEKIGQKGF